MALLSPAPCTPLSTTVYTPPPSCDACAGHTFAYGSAAAAACARTCWRAEGAARRWRAQCGAAHRRSLSGTARPLQQRLPPQNRCESASQAAPAPAAAGGAAVAAAAAPWPAGRQGAGGVTDLRQQPGHARCECVMRHARSVNVSARGVCVYKTRATCTKGQDATGMGTGYGRDELRHAKLATHTHMHTHQERTDVGGHARAAASPGCAAQPWWQRPQPSRRCGGRRPAGPEGPRACPGPCQAPGAPGWSAALAQTGLEVGGQVGDTDGCMGGGLFLLRMDGLAHVGVWVMSWWVHTCGRR